MAESPVLKAPREFSDPDSVIQPGIVRQIVEDLELRRFKGMRRFSLQDVTMSEPDMTNCNARDLELEYVALDLMQYLPADRASDILKQFNAMGSPKKHSSATTASNSPPHGHLLKFPKHKAEANGKSLTPPPTAHFRRHTFQPITKQADAHKCHTRPVRKVEEKVHKKLSVNVAVETDRFTKRDDKAALIVKDGMVDNVTIVAAKSADVKNADTVDSVGESVVGVKSMPVKRGWCFKFLVFVVVLIAVMAALALIDDDEDL